MAVCPVCEYRNPEKAALCENCGAGLVLSPEAAQLAATLDPGAAPEAAATPPPPPEPAPATQAEATPPPAPDVQACPVCNSPNPPNADACSQCGLDFKALERAAKGLPPEEPLTVAPRPRMSRKKVGWAAGIAVGLALAAVAGMAIWSHYTKTRDERLRGEDPPGENASTPTGPGETVQPSPPSTGPESANLTPTPSIGPVPGTGPAGERIWEGVVRGPIKASAAAAGNLIVVGDLENRLYAFDLTGGTRTWECELDGWVNATPVVASDTVFVATRTGTLYAVGLADGTVAAQLPQGDEVIAGPDGTAAALYLATRSGLLRSVAWNGSAFAVRWERRIGERVESDLRAVADAVLVATEEGTLMRFRGDTGEIDWRQAIGGFPSGGLAVSEDAVYMSVDDSGRARVERRDLATGARRWERALLGRPEYAPAAAGAWVFVPVGTRLAALDAATGEVRWTFQSGQVVGQPAVVENVVVVGGFDRRVRALEAATGRVLWAHELSWYAPAGPLVAAGLVVTGTIDRRIFALRASP